MESKLPNIYCVKCRKHTPNNGDIKIIITENGRRRAKAKCLVCGIEKSSFITTKNV